MTLKSHRNHFYESAPVLTAAIIVSSLIVLPVLVYGVLVVLTMPNH